MWYAYIVMCFSAISSSPSFMFSNCFSTAIWFTSSDRVTLFIGKMVILFQYLKAKRQKKCTEFQHHANLAAADFPTKFSTMVIRRASSRSSTTLIAKRNCLAQTSADSWGPEWPRPSLVNKMQRTHIQSKRSMGPSHVMHEERALSQALHMPLPSVPTAHLEESQSLFDLNAILPAGKPLGCKQPFWSPVSSHTFFPKDPEVLTHSCSGISYAKIGQTHHAVWMSTHSLFSMHYHGMYRSRYHT